jgi:hypothetical protein
MFYDAQKQRDFYIKGSGILVTNSDSAQRVLSEMLVSILRFDKQNLSLVVRMRHEGV